MTDQEQFEARWDMHTQRQVESSKGAALAITALNSGSWFALLTQAGKLRYDGLEVTFGAWGIGAFLGTLLWVFIYRGTAISQHHDQNRTDPTIRKKLNNNIWMGVGTAILGLLSFIVGLLVLVAEI